MTDFGSIKVDPQGATVVVDIHEGEERPTMYASSDGTNEVEFPFELSAPTLFWTERPAPRYRAREFVVEVSLNDVTILVQTKHVGYQVASDPTVTVTLEALSLGEYQDTAGSPGGGAPSGPGDALTSLPFWGKFVATGFGGGLTLFDPAQSTFDELDPARLVTYIGRNDYHGSRQQTIGFVSEHEDGGYAEFGFSVWTSSDTNNGPQGGTQSSNVYSSSGDEYVSLGVSANIRPNGTGRGGGFSVYADNTQGGNYAAQLGILADDDAALELFLQTGQATAPIRTHNAAGALGFSVGVAGGIGLFGTAPPAAKSAHGATAADAIACLVNFGLMAAA